MKKDLGSLRFRLFSIVLMDKREQNPFTSILQKSLSRSKLSQFNMTKTEPEIPMASAVAVIEPPSSAVVATAAPPQAPVVTVDLPIGSSSGYMFDGNPPRVTQVMNDDPSYSYLVGYYVASLQMPGLEISNMSDCNRLRENILANQAVARKLVLTQHPPTTAATTVAVGCLYAHDLPTGSVTDLGIALDGFPPKITASTGVMAGRLHPGQTVDALYVPGQAALTLQSGGFTGHRIVTVLNETQKMSGRKLVVKDRPDYMHTQPREEAHNLFDFGGLGGWFRPRKKVVTKSFGRKKK